MTPLLIILVLSLAVLGAAAYAYWGANRLFHPPKMIPHTIWPDQFGLAFEPVDFRSEDGIRLRGWLIPCGTATGRTILCCHGWGDNKGDLLKRIQFLSRKFNLFLFDSRSHGESEGTMTTIGYLERRDFDAALRFLKTARPGWAAHLGLFGLSMGAVMAIRGMAEHPDFQCAAFESPYRSFGEVIAQFTWNNFRLPYFPFVWAILLRIRGFLGDNPETCSPSRYIGRLPRRPILFIAGELDPLMPVRVVRALCDSAAEPKEFYMAPGATHGRCWEADARGYREKLTSFFDKSIA